MPHANRQAIVLGCLKMCSISCVQILYSCGVDEILGGQIQAILSCRYSCNRRIEPGQVATLLYRDGKAQLGCCRTAVWRIDVTHSAAEVLSTKSTVIAISSYTAPREFQRVLITVAPSTCQRSARPRFSPRKPRSGTL